MNLGSEFDVVTLIYITKLGLKVQKIDVRTQKIDNSSFKTFRIVLANF